MISRRPVAYRVRGIVSGDGPSRELVSRADPRMRAFLANDLSEFDGDVDRGTAIANLMLTGGLGLAEQDQTALTRRLEGEIASIRGIRQQRYGKGPFLVVVLDTPVYEYTRDLERELDDFIVCFDGVANQAVNAATEAILPACVASLAMATGLVVGLDEVLDSVVTYRDDGKPIYSFMITGRNNGYASHYLKESALNQVPDLFSSLLLAEPLKRVLELILSSLQAEVDVQRTFGAAWGALEMLVKEVSPTYEASRGGGLAYKFWTIASALDADEAAADSALFRSLYELRQQRYHEQRFASSDSLPIKDAMDLALKYLKLHLAHDGADST